ncbi:MAG: hypothetical protein R2780_04780 [Crocinitomicaceae bacterium]|nr:hypothetical protein [Crocinitomicaceae bacterium]
MRKLKKNLLAVGMLFLMGTYSFAGETYTNEDAKFKITFPSSYDVSSDQQDGVTVLSLSATYQSMILLVSVFVYEEVVPEDEYAVKVAEGIITTADAFNSKFNEKKCVRWNGGGSNPGLKNAIKGKVSNGSGGSFNFFGNIYITMAYGIEYRISALSTSKKGFDAGIESAFVNSFKLL